MEGSIRKVSEDIHLYSMLSLAFLVDTPRKEKEDYYAWPRSCLFTSSP